MTALLSVHDFRFGTTGPALSFSLKEGQMMAVFGPAGSGKTRFIRSLCGLERNYRGSVRWGADVALAGYPEPSRRLTPESMARRVALRTGAGRVAEALAATHLWEQRRTPFGDLSPSAQASAGLLHVLASPARLLFIDGQLDRIDPWTRASVDELLAHRLAHGVAVVVATGRTDLAPRSDLLAVWKRQELAYAGSYEELARGRTIHLEVEALYDTTARALCDPFEVAIESENGLMKLSAKDGQSLAARMLLEGYGDVRTVIARPPTPEEVIGSL